MQKVDELYKQRDQLTEADWQQIVAAVHELPSLIHFGRLTQKDAGTRLHGIDSQEDQSQADSAFVDLCKEKLVAYKTLLAYRAAEINRDAMEAGMEVSEAMESAGDRVRGNMNLFCDRKIAAYCAGDSPMISPFLPESVKTMMINGVPCRIPSKGLSSAGYDITLGRDFWVRKKKDQPVSLVGSPDEDLFDTYNDVDKIHLPPYGFCLAISEEYFMMPNNVVGNAWGKSTLARAGVLTPLTPLEPGWNGYLTLEIYNMGPDPVELVAGIGISQVQFLEIASPDKAYADKGGRYQDQQSIVPAQ